jgi:hypothetical protein
MAVQYLFLLPVPYLRNPSCYRAFDGAPKMLAYLGCHLGTPKKSKISWGAVYTFSYGEKSLPYSSMANLSVIWAM